MTTFRFYSDPGHGWLKVPRKLLQELGIDDEISSYSYQRSDYVYIEEDCDLCSFNAAMKTANRPYKFKETANRRRLSRIRNYESYKP